MREAEYGYGRKGWGSIDGNPGFAPGGPPREGFGGIEGVRD